MDKKESKAKSIFGRIRKIKHIEWIIAGIAIVVMLGIYLTAFLPNRSANADTNRPNDTIVGNGTLNYFEYMENRLTRTLSQIDGVGRTEVIIKWESSVETIIAYITSESNGTTSSSPAIINTQGGSRPIVLKEIMPRALGVVVVAQGASDVRVMLNIINAVTTLLGVPQDSVSVFAMAP